MSRSRQVLGKLGEKIILAEYLKRDYLLVCKNFQYYQPGQKGRIGEIDLILTKTPLLVLVEVKTRSSDYLGSAVEHLTSKKLQLLKQTLEFFIYKNPIYNDYAVRFDLGLVTKQKIQIIPNAYSFDY